MIRSRAFGWLLLAICCAGLTVVALRSVSFTDASPVGALTEDELPARIWSSWPAAGADLGSVVAGVAHQAARQEAALVAARQVEAAVIDRAARYEEAFVLYASTPGEPVVYLTFDDGPSPSTLPIMDLLDARGWTATFFVVGVQIEWQKDRLAEIHRRGHVVGNHTWNHAWLTRIPNEGVVAELMRTQEIIAEVLGFAPPCYRPPFGAVDDRVREVARDLGFTTVLWDVDSADWQGGSPEQIAANVLDHVKPGDTVLLHDGPTARPATVAATAIILEEFAARGWEVRAHPACTS